MKGLIKRNCSDALAQRPGWLRVRVSIVRLRELFLGS
ncbi:hypothetical protein M7I_7711 [Glarea lozoyensis 74030]|uniref:Uncharacterized protein n=1 Tax=Glarea lozoyensis (strain ATCC 74030 / MF5533) TaxID=1104152 RepID=H0EY15_GLAL7|nr:hypothetical protein M7I_7711 [Glarea lozoyensis 74030]